MHKLASAVLPGPRVFKGWLYVLSGALLALIPMVPAGVAAVAWTPPASRPWTLLLFTAVCAAMLAWPRFIRDAHAHFVSVLLGERVPQPRTHTWPDRLRASVWVVAHCAGGVLLAGLTFAVWLSAVGPVLFWLDGGNTFDYYFFTMEVPGDRSGLWTVPLAAAEIGVLGLIAAGMIALYRRFAPLFLAPRAAERVAVLEERTAVLTQRDRLAQELHDSIGHTLTASTIQAQVAGQLMDDDPELARKALSSIEESSRTALEDLDHVLGLLREGKAPRAPHRTLADLEALLEHVSRTGTEVMSTVEGVLAKVPATVSREAYRVVREGFTNAMRHAPKAPVTLKVDAGPRWLTVEMTNPMTAAGSSHRGGSGLVGIVDRVRLLRGEVAFAPVVTPAGERWRLFARLPIRSGA